jgi:hypothetical protein
MQVEQEDEEEEDIEEEEKEEEEAEAAAALRAAARQEAERARHTAAQQKVWQRLLAARIRLQGAVSAANRLPLARSESAAAGELKGSAGAALRSDLRARLAELARLRLLLGASHPELASGFGPGSVPAVPGAESDSAAWWQWLATASAAGRATEERIVNEWNQRTNIQAGKSGFKGAAFFFFRPFVRLVGQRLARR